MSTQGKLPLYVSWRKLKDVLGWPYGRTHTNRLETEPEYYGDDPFPRRGKIGPHRNSHPIWYTPAVLDYFKRHGLPAPELVVFSCRKPLKGGPTWPSSPACSASSTA